ncbi:MAG: hypothetical protein K2X47_04905, partial [Bdellovibrionales bacterium]|nr:hypothetical protein [Bdellovibrionales bacterium]
FLASTPVESISYDSRAQMFTAKVKLQEGTSIDIGTDTDRLKQIGINRHISGPWYIYTYLKNPTAGEERSTSAFIEWVLKY